MKPSRGFISFLGLVAVVAVFAPQSPLVAQKREDFIALQRDVAQLQDQLKQLQTEQNQKLDALQKLIQQAVDASLKADRSVAQVQDNLRNSMNEQQQRTAAPLATMNNKLNQVSEDVGTIKENIGDLESRMTKVDGKLADISTAVRTLSTPPPAPPNANAAPAPSAAAADALFESARRDYSSGNDTLAMQEFEDYLKNFPTFVEHAPDAYYYMGMILDRAKPPQYDDAIQAFDAVVERYPENPKTPEALYMKGVDLMKAKRNSEAAAEFRNFLKTYPNHPNAAKAQGHLREINASAPPARGKKKAN